MAPNGELLVSSGGNGGGISKNKLNGGEKKARASVSERLQRAMSDLSLELKREAGAGSARKLGAISELEEAKCECCGMSEECTPGYVRRVRKEYSGRWICGLCAAAVKEEAERMGGRDIGEEALRAHMNACSAFSRVARKLPVLHQAEAMRQILRKRACRLKTDQSPATAAVSAKKKTNERGIMRTSSCIAAITEKNNGRFSVN